MKDSKQDTLIDPWREYNRECTSFVAWRLHIRNGFEMPFHDNAYLWKSDAQNRGYLVDMSPAVGSVAWWGKSTTRPKGHVAWVESISSDGSHVTIEQYNASGTGTYSEQTIATSSVGGFIHFKDLSSSSLPVAVAPTSDGHIQVFSDANGTLRENWYDPVNGQIGGGSSVGGMTVQGTPALVARSGQQVIDAFIRNSAGQIVETWYNWGTGQWGGWITISGATFTSSPAVVATSDGHDQVFASNNGTIEQNWFDLVTGKTGNWITI